MTNPEILARLTPGSLDPSRIRYQGGVPTHTAGEIAGALAGITPGASYYAHAVFMGHSNGGLVAAIMVELSKDKRIRRLPEQIPGMVLGLARIGAFEAMPENGICRTCKGQGSGTIRGRVVECEVCGGSGRKRTSSRQQCRIFNEALSDWVQERLKRGKDGTPRKIHHDVWDKRWRRQYEDLVPPILGKWHSEIWSAVNRELKG